MTSENNPGSTVNWVYKGQNPSTEMYSCMRAEVEVPSDASTSFNDSLMTEFLLFDKLYVAGQAKSHCVNFSVRDILPRFHRGGIVLLEDCMSSVAGFEKEGDEFFEWAKGEGAKVCKEKTVR